MTYRSFELDPTIGRDIKENMYEMLAKKYSMTLEQSKANTKNMVQMAKEVGLDYRLDSLILTNTFDAHRLTLFAKEQGLMAEMTERILQAYFTESKHIGDHATLAELAADVGLDKEEAYKMLTSDAFAEAVRKDERTAAEYGVTGVPFYLVNQKYALTGAQPTEVFVEALKQIIEEDEPVIQSKEKEAICDEDGCEVPEK